MKKLTRKEYREYCKTISMSAATIVSVQMVWLALIEELKLDVKKQKMYEDKAYNFIVEMINNNPKKVEQIRAEVKAGKQMINLFGFNI